MAKSKSGRAEDAFLGTLGIDRSSHADEINAKNARAGAEMKGFELLLNLGRD